MDVCLVCLYVVLSFVGTGLCDGLITRPEDSYRVSNCICDQETPKREAEGPSWTISSCEWMLTFITDSYSNSKVASVKWWCDTGNAHARSYRYCRKNYCNPSNCNSYLFRRILTLNRNCVLKSINKLIFLMVKCCVFVAVDCRLVVVMEWDCRLSTAALGLLYYPRMIAVWASE
jgi:hypothetical protein